MAAYKRGVRAMARFTVNHVSYYAEQWHEGAPETLVLLHGFTGSTKTWTHLANALPNVHVIAIDCIGHGQTDAPAHLAPYTMDAQIEALQAIFDQLQLTSFMLLGYSMGGRIALSYTCRYPQRVTQLMLESASPGLMDDGDRQARKKADEALADKIMRNGVPSFVEAWANIPLFATQKSLPFDVQQAIWEERIHQRGIGLANSLRGMGTGVMPPLWDALSQLPLPVTLITGELDHKFVQLNKKMEKSLRNAKHVIIPAVGHAIHVENPIKFATIVKETISPNI